MTPSGLREEEVEGLYRLTSGWPGLVTPTLAALGRQGALPPRERGGSSPPGGPPIMTPSPTGPQTTSSLWQLDGS